jgi:hypothetical protein
MNKKSMIATIASSILGLLMASTANANLIVNGGFEEPDVKNGSWSFFTSANVSGWSGSNIEIWENFNGVVAEEGVQFAELNSHPGNGDAFTIFQDFSTVQGVNYSVSFAYRARSKNNEAFKVEISDLGGQSGNIVSWLIEDHTTSGWNQFNASFVAASAQSQISFTTITPRTGTVGNFIDDVSVVPEPTALALMGLGLVGLGFTRRKLSK